MKLLHQHTLTPVDPKTILNNIQIIVPSYLSLLSDQSTNTLKNRKYPNCIQKYITYFTDSSPYRQDIPLTTVLHAQ